MNMKQNKKKHMWMGIWFLLAFLLWTALIRCADVQAVGPYGTKVGFAVFNLWFHHLTGVHMTIYTITDWLGLVPIAVCLGFGFVGDPSSGAVLCSGDSRLPDLRDDPDQLQADPDRRSVGGLLPLLHDAAGFECDADACVSGGQKMEKKDSKAGGKPIRRPVLCLHGARQSGVGCSLGDGHCRFRFAELWFIQALPKRGKRDRFEESKWSSMKSCRN